MRRFVHASPHLLGEVDDTYFLAGAENVSYRADVTSLVTGDDDFVIAGFPSFTATADTQGAALVIVWEDPSRDDFGTKCFIDVALDIRSTMAVAYDGGVGLDGGAMDAGAVDGGSTSTDGGAFDASGIDAASSSDAGPISGGMWMFGARPHGAARRARGDGILGLAALRRTRRHPMRNR